MDSQPASFVPAETKVKHARKLLESKVLQTASCVKQTYPRRVRLRTVSSPKTSCGDFPSARMICSMRLRVADCSPVISR